MFDRPFLAWSEGRMMMTATNKENVRRMTVTLEKILLHTLRNIEIEPLGTINSYTFTIVIL